MAGVHRPSGLQARMGGQIAHPGRLRGTGVVFSSLPNTIRESETRLAPVLQVLRTEEGKTKALLEGGRSTSWSYRSQDLGDARGAHIISRHKAKDISNAIGRDFV